MNKFKPDFIDLNQFERSDLICIYLIPWFLLKNLLNWLTILQQQISMIENSTNKVIPIFPKDIVPHRIKY